MAGGESPFTLVVKGASTAYVSSVRDREVVVVDVAGTVLGPVTRIPLAGNPNSMIFNADQSRLFVTHDLVARHEAGGPAAEKGRAVHL